MKTFSTTFWAATTVCACCFVTANRAQGQVPQIAASSGTTLFQGGLSFKAGVTTIKAPIRSASSTATLLQSLAFDETVNGSWFNTEAKVPAGARLEVTFAGLGDFSGLSYKVVSGKKTVDVSNIISAAPSGSNYVSSATYTDANGPKAPPFTATDYHLYTITYDSRAVGGKLHYTVTGMATSSAKATKPAAKTGVYTETDTFSLIDGTGSGVDLDGTVFLLSGITVTASGTAIIRPPAPASSPGSAGNSMGGLGGGSFSSSGASSEQISAPPIPPLHP